MPTRPYLCFERQAAIANANGAPRASPLCFLPGSVLAIGSSRKFIERTEPTRMRSRREGMNFLPEYGSGYRTNEGSFSDVQRLGGLT